VQNDRRNTYNDNEDLSGKIPNNLNNYLSAGHPAHFKYNIAETVQNE